MDEAVRSQLWAQHWSWAVTAGAGGLYLLPAVVGGSGISLFHVFHFHPPDSLYSSAPAWEETLKSSLTPRFPSLHSVLSKIRHQSELSCGWWSRAMRRPSRQRWAFSSGWSLICFACSGQSSYQGNIIRQRGRSCNEKHSDGQRCPEVSVMEASCLNEVS